MAVIGLGLMGGSLAQSLKGKCAQLLGVDPDPATLGKALQDGVIAQGFASIRELPPEVDVLILAVPIHSILDALESLETDFTGQAIIMDLGSTKNAILNAMQSLPPRFDPIGGHPMCGKEISGYDQADAGMYKGAVFALTPLERTSPAAARFAADLVSVIGAVPFWTDAHTHDRLAALTSHLPYLLANSLAAITPDLAAPLAGPGFFSTARLAPTSSEMMRDIIQTNRKNILNAVHAFQEHLTQAAALLESEDDEQWQRIAGIGKAQYNAILNRRSNRNNT